MSRRRQPQPGAVSTGRLVDLSKGMVDVVHPALINDAESVLLRNGNLDEKGTLKPALGRVARYGSNFDTTPLAGMDVFSPDLATSRLVFGTEGGRLYHDTPHLIARYDSQAEWNSGNFQGGASATSEGSLIMPPAGDPTFARNSIAFLQNGASVASGVPRYEYHRFPHHRWQDLFDTDQIATHYTSGGDVTGATAVSDGVLSYSGGEQATLLRSGLALADGEITVNTDQAGDAGVVFRHVDNANHYMFALRDDSGATANNVQLYRRVAGAFTSVASADITWARGTAQQFRVTFHGSLIEVWHGNVRVLSVTDTTFTTGGVGLRNNHATAFRVLDWTVNQAQQGMMVEESTTNVVRSNGGADPLFSSDTGWTAMGQGQSIANGVATLQSPDGIAISGFQCILTNLPQNTLHSYAIRARHRDTSGTSTDLVLDLMATGYDSPNQEMQVHPAQLSTSFQTFVRDGFNSELAPASVNLRIFTFSTRPIEIDFVQLEQKAFATTITDSPRAAETLTIPTAGIFTRGNWTIEGIYTPQIPMSVGSVEKVVFNLVIDANNFYRLSVGWEGEWRFLIRSGGVDRLITSANGVVVQGTAYLWQISGDGTTMRLCVNGVQVGETTYTEPVGALPANMHIGSDDTGGQQANGVISNLRISSRARTLAEHQTAWNSGQPLAMDTDATYLLPKNGSLAVTQPITGRWFTPAIDCSMARDRASGQATHVAATPGASGIAVQSRSAATSTGPWSAWTAATGTGLLQHPVNDFVQVLLQLNRSGADSPSVDRLVVSFDGTPAAQLLASDFTAHGQFYFGSLMSLMVVVNRLNAPRRYDGTVLTVLAGSPPHAAHVAAHKNRMFMAHTAANSSRLFFSDVLNVESWPVLNFIDISPNDGDWITGLLVLDDYLVITKNRSVWLLLGSSIEDFSVRRLHAEAGCIAPRSLTRVGEGFAFVAHDGVYMSNMSQVQLVTERIRKTWDGLNRRRLFQATAIFHRHKLRIDVPNGASITNNLRIIHDGIRNALYLEEMTAHASCYAKFTEAGRESLLFGHSTVGQISEADTGFTDGGQPINFVWESKHFDFGVPERVKRWRRMFMEIAPAATATNLNVAFIVGGGAPSAALSVNVPGDATNRIHAARLLPSQVGVVQGHSIGFRVTQSTTNGGVGIHGLALDFFVKGARPTL